MGADGTKFRLRLHHPCPGRIVQHVLILATVWQTTRQKPLILVESPYGRGSDDRSYLGNRGYLVVKGWALGLATSYDRIRDLDLHLSTLALDVSSPRCEIQL